MHCSTLAIGFVAFVLGTAAACGDSSITACSYEPDVTGGWGLHLSPEAADAGAQATIPAETDLEVVLEQGDKTDFLGLGHYVYGAISAQDPSYFQTLTIPRLVNNDGSKTGAILGCELRINVPVATPVSDDNVDQGPLRLALIGNIVGRGMIAGVMGSRLIMDGETSPRTFSWQGIRR